MIRGLLLVVSAPSGAGKSTLCQALVQRRPDLTLSVSCTTRPPRPTEKNGVDYHFLSETDFEKRVTEGAFLEWARVHGFAYGTPRDRIDQALTAGRDVVLNIDIQGAESVRKAFPLESVRVFITPPSWKELEARLRGRNQDSDDVIQRRLANARAELAHASRYDYWVINDDLENALEELDVILRAEHRRVPRLSEELAALEHWGLAKSARI